MHKLKIISIATISLLIVIFAVFLLQPEPSEIQTIPRSESADIPIPDFSSYEQVREKKQAFFSYLRPEIEAQNEHILRQREFVHGLRAKHIAGETISEKQKKELLWLSQEYRAKNVDDLDRLFDELLIKIDIIPVELVLVQTANESAWGTSRFATQGYNFFGLWCFKKGCGFVPKRRNDGAAHEVAKFENLSTAVYTYLRNLNRHDAYKELRAIRKQLREKMLPISASALSEGLTKYSERGDEYIVELKQMLRVNKELM
ncbi:glucosaminidase domain-containing protein [Glaciecola sp. MH2013]|uniref:glucosaminidase domain-containing protein n=1 Tax=Glaciecola sp. MH2013 TaxID=2785524 RepID=UPI00189C74AD|nr:glucosaminidase domain-containing protein [Glaciecola sp. MH2013]MBF7072838.1 glucosaminidase domain-containing protein [Glaciecola sp. MH2013]